jgi:pseudooxynicotine oxidase
MADCDALVVGAGFAGVVAARELSRAGQRVILLEGRDRLGGRTWTKTDALPGRALELGGTWVHWFQPHVWAEITRYGLEVTESLGSSAPEEVRYISGGERRIGDSELLWPLLEEANAQFCVDAAEVLPRPYEPLHEEEALGAVDALSVQDRIEKLDVSGEQRDLLSAFWGTCCSARCGEAGLVAMLRWFALSGWSLGLLFDAVARYKLKAGTVGLIDAIAADGGAEIRLAAPVAAVQQDDDGVTVRIRGGASLRAATAVVTVPLNALGRIRFTPQLSVLKQRAAAEGQASHGSKLWVQVRGDLPRALLALAPDDHLIQYLHTEELLADGQLLVGLGCDAAALDVTRVEAVTAPVRALLGDVEVTATTGHDWLADEFSLGTWPVFRPNQTVRFLRGLQAPEGRVYFAGSETANGWNGFIDGAIESGLRAAREVASRGARERASSVD